MTPDTTTPPLVLFSGLAADRRIFAPQAKAFPQLIVPEWPTPKRGETLAAYCDRLANDLRQAAPAVIGGASFGGIVALHVAQRIDAQAVVLIGSVRSPEQFPLWIKCARWVRPVVGLLPVRLMQRACWPFTWRPISKVAPHLSGVARQFCECNPRVFKWSLQQLLAWNNTPQPPCPVYHIHGSRDHVLPARHTAPDTRINGAGHVPSMTHPGEVNAFLRQVLQGATSGNSPRQS